MNFIKINTKYYIYSGSAKIREARAVQAVLYALTADAGTYILTPVLLPNGVAPIVGGVVDSMWTSPMTALPCHQTFDMYPRVAGTVISNSE